MTIVDPDNNTDVMIWSKDYRLTWDDFQREPITTKRQAESTVGLRRKIADTEIFEKEDKYFFRLVCDGVSSYFNKKESWVLEKQKNASNQELILKHEQGHFNLMEIYAIQYREEIQKLCQKTFECFGNSQKERKAFSEKKSKKLLNKIEQIIVIKCNNEQLKYDEITNYGQNEPEQLEYLKNIEKNLHN